ncbi:polysaccharide pyruvyl transferase family protein [Amnibacterium kyonggiense]
MPNDKPTLVLLGTHGQHNIGDELLLQTFLHRFGTGWHYVINTYDPESTAGLLGSRYDAVYVDTARDRSALVRHLLRAHAVVFGGGSILKELYPTTGRAKHSTLLMVLAIVVLAKRLLRVPVAMLDIGVGPIETRVGRLIARGILRQVDMISVRDEASFALCLRLGAAAKVRRSADPVFGQTVERLSDAAVRRGGGARTRSDVLRIALSLNFHIADPGNWDAFQTVLADALLTVAEGRRIELHALPMQSRGKTRHDAEVLTEFAERVPHLPFVHHRPTTHQDVVRIIDDCDVVVAERFHAIVLAALLGRPTFALSYDVKVTELARQLGLEEHSADITRRLTPAAFTAALESLIADLPAARARLIEATAPLVQRARSESVRSLQWLEELPA